MLDILLVDDEPSIRLSVGDALRGAGHHVTLASEGGEAVSLIESHLYDVVITDIRLPKVDGITLFRKIRSEAPSTDVILITAYGAVADAVSALKEGARDYLTKPFDNEEIRIRLEAIAQRRSLEQNLAAARAELATRPAEQNIIGASPSMARLLDRVQTMAASDAPVLITGESGTGKELVARSLHGLSPRKAKPFVAVSCAAFPETLLEAELFGHERGAFTGAVRKREGRFKAADGGTLFLDEVAEIPLPAQAKLLRVLQEGAFEPLGTNTPVHVDVRIISATHRDLKERIAEGRFREDLYYRLNVLDISIPPLRDRRADLTVLVQHFLKQFSPQGSAIPGISPRAWAVLNAYPFPGNVRELEHAIQHAVVLARGKEIDVEHLPADMARKAGPPGDLVTRNGEVRTLATAAKEFERTYLIHALSAAGGKKAVAADMLGISRKNLWEKLKAHGVHDATKGEEED
jgi:DNA-binding NtrC family response regulator